MWRALLLLVMLSASIRVSMQLSAQECIRSLWECLPVRCQLRLAVKRRSSLCFQCLAYHPSRGLAILLTLCHSSKRFLQNVRPFFYSLRIPQPHFGVMSKTLRHERLSKIEVSDLLLDTSELQRS